MKLSLKAARVDANLTQEDMAKALNIHVQTYRKLEEKPDTATIEQAKIISERVGRSYNEIFFAS